MSLNIGIVIPARYESSRLPGKPLIDLCGKTMIQRTWERCIQALPASQVYIATDSEKIQQHVESFGGQVVMTSPECLTGTDRLAEANEILNLDIVVNVQGDEPIIDPDEIVKVVEYSLKHPTVVVNAMAKIQAEEEFRSLTIPKVAKTVDNQLLYMSRAPIPGSKSAVFDFGYKQICIYAFPKDKLKLFAATKEKTPFELVEDIEILRFVEKGEPVSLVEVSGQSMAVDVLEDAERVREKISSMPQ